jgi:5'-nucleotidase
MDNKKILYVDMDNVLVDFASGINRLDANLIRKYEGRLDEVPGIFSLMDPIDGAVEAYEKLAGNFDAYVLSTAPWENPSAWHQKLIWVKKYLSTSAYKRLILTHHKNLNKGDYLIDDRIKNGVDKFKGEHIHFGTDKFPDWKSVMIYLLGSDWQASQHRQ